MKTTLIFTSILFVFLPFSKPAAQCNNQPCAPGEVEPGLCAEDACLISNLIDLDGFVGSTTDLINTCDVPGPFCGSVESNIWFAFNAPVEVVTFEFIVENCIGQPTGGGLQAEVYQSSDCNSFVSVSNCWSPSLPVNGSVTALNLNIGETYFLMIDSWAGDICDFTIKVDCESLVAQNSEAPNIVGPLAVCPGQTTTYFAELPDCMHSPTWLFTGNGTMTTTPDQTEATVTWGAPVEGTLCLGAVLFDGTPVEHCEEINVMHATAEPDSISHPWNNDSEIEICAGETFFVQADDPSQGTSDLTFEYFFAGESVATGQTFSHVFHYPNEVDFTIVASSEACSEMDTFELTIIVHPAPTATVSIEPDLPICFGDAAILTLDAGSDTFFYSDLSTVTQVYAPPFPLPDGDGLTAEAIIPISSAAPGAVITDVSDMKICVNMEHSWMRDLEIKLTCPSGESAILHDHAGNIGGEVFLGIPNENDEGLPEPIPGEGFEYCWTADPSNGTWLEFSNTFSFSTLPSDDYSPFEPLENFIGCPINGEWVLSITDLWAVDNGVLFEASLAIETLDTGFVTFENTAEWLPDPDIDVYSTDVIAVSPESTSFFSYAISNNFGCTSVVDVPVAVLPEAAPFCLPCDSLFVEAGSINITCNNPLPIAINATSNYPNNIVEFQWTKNGVLISEQSFIVVNDIAEYVVTIVYPDLNCVATDTLTIIQDSEIPVADAGADNIQLIGCPDGMSVVLDGSNSDSGPDITYFWVDIFGQFISQEVTATVEEPGLYTLTVFDLASSCSNSDIIQVLPGDPVEWGVETTPDSCGFAVGTATAFVEPEPAILNYLWSNGNTEAQATNLPYGSHAVTLQWADCPAVALPVFIDSLECNFVSGLEKIEGLNSVNIFPNPTEGHLTLSFELAKKESLEFTLMDILGREMIHYAPQNFPAGKNSIDFDLKKLASGNYFLKIKSGGQYRIMRVERM